jgi:hypothetical protein
MTDDWGKTTFTAHGYIYTGMGWDGSDSGTNNKIWKMWFCQNGSWSYPVVVDRYGM